MPHMPPVPSQKFIVIVRAWRPAWPHHSPSTCSRYARSSCLAGRPERSRRFSDELRRRGTTINRANSGFTLLETAVATGVLLASLCGVAPLFLSATRANQHGRELTIGALLASEKIEELRYAQPVVGGSLDESVSGFSDLHGAGGELLDTGHAVSGATHVRRWSIEPLAGRSATFVFQVRVMSRGGEIRLVGIRRSGSS